MKKYSLTSRVLLLAAVGGQGSQAMAAPDASVDVVARAGASSNPFLVNDGDTNGAFVELGIEPRLLFRGARREYGLYGFVRQRQFFERYGDDFAAGLRATGSQRVSERLTVGAELGLSSSISGGLDSGLRGLGTLPTPGVVADPSLFNPILNNPVGNDVFLPDVGLAGIRQRVNTAQGSSSLAYQLGPRGQLEAALGFTLTRYPGLSGIDNDAFGGSVGYSRTLSPRSTAGFRFSADRTDYAAIGIESMTYRSQATYRRQLTENWSVDAAVGLLYLDSQLPSGDEKSVGLSANVRACRQLERTALCVSAVRDAANGAGMGVGTQTSIGASLSRRLDEDQSLSFAVSYDRSNQRFFLNQTDLVAMEGRSVELVAATGSYERRLSRRLSGGATATYRDLYGFNRAPGADVGAMAFIRARFGDRR